MIIALSRLATPLPVGQLVRVHRDDKIWIARIGSLAQGGPTAYLLDQTYTQDDAHYSDAQLEPVIELFFEPVSNTDLSHGYHVIVRNGPLRVLGTVVQTGPRWHATPAGGAALPGKHRSRKAAALQLIDLRRQATVDPDL